MDKIVSLAKRRGFIYQGSEIYGGLAGTWDYGPLGVELLENLKQIWWRLFVTERDDVYGLKSAILMNSAVWRAAGHVDNFTDPLSECGSCRRRFRADQLTDSINCPECGGRLNEPRQFNMLFTTRVGAVEDSASVVYLRPETAQGMFINFKNVIDSFHPKLPFGLAQIGKAFRNEITPRDFTFRSREFEQMEVEYFVRPTEWENSFEVWRQLIWDYIKAVGINDRLIHELEVGEQDRAHYSKRTIDFEFDYPFGRKELYGLAYRTDFDLKNHATASGIDLAYYDEERRDRFIPHVIEPSLGIDRTVLAVLLSAYREDELGGEPRAYLAFKLGVAPVRAAIFPLLKNKPELVAKARTVFAGLKKEFGNIMFDDNGNIGKRYRRQDEIGTPFCVTIDFQTIEDDTVTIRDRDTGGQERVKISDLASRLRVC